ncbi:MAG: PhoH family protein [Alphaproteobacteria bacterium]|nr:PhoH family protein [Alphaproteobacteria bacterium]
MNFDDNRFLAALFGEHDRNLARIEKELDVEVSSRGNRILITGNSWSQQAAKSALTNLYELLAQGDELSDGEVTGAIRMAEASVTEHGPDMDLDSSTDNAGSVIRTRRRAVTPRSPNQAAYVREMRTNDMVFGLGPAGTGKTFLAVALGVSMLIEGRVERIVLSRPAVEAGDRLGFLPGDVREKVDPYMRPLYDALYYTLPADQVAKYLDAGVIEIAPLAFMRGRTLADAFIILDEAQNTTRVQMKMLLTRMGESSRMVITGDLSQIDLPTGERSGLAEAADILAGMEGVGFVRFTDADVLRHPLVSRVVRAYQSHSDKNGPKEAKKKT